MCVGKEDLSTVWSFRGTQVGFQELHPKQAFETGMFCGHRVKVLPPPTSWTKLALERATMHTLSQVVLPQKP